MKIAGAVLGVLIAVLTLTWIMQGNDFFMFKVFAPAYEQVRRDNKGYVWEKSTHALFFYAARVDIPHLGILKSKI